MALNLRGDTLDELSIVFDDVYKCYGETEALKGVSFSVRRGECVALLGPNGAGKTTALEILLGLRRADRGSAGMRGTIACTPQATGFPDALRVGELVAFAVAHYPSAFSPDAILEAFDLKSVARSRVGTLSGGVQRRVALALACGMNADVVVLDEPTTGLDAESRRRLWSQLNAGIANRTTLFTTHYMEEAEALATRIILIDRGRVLFDGTPAAFRERFGRRHIQYTGDPIALPDASVVHAGPRTIVATDDTDAYIRALVTSNVPFSDLCITQSSFEEIFLQLTEAGK